MPVEKLHLYEEFSYTWRHIFGEATDFWMKREDIMMIGNITETI